MNIEGVVAHNTCAFGPHRPMALLKDFGVNGIVDQHTAYVEAMGFPSPDRNTVRRLVIA